MTKAFILGAGLGTRLRPLTNSLPKPLIPVFNAPLVTYALDHCRQSGIDEFAINTHHLPEKWESLPPAPISFFHEPDLLETGGGIKNIESWIRTDSILIYNGDILTDLDLDRLLATHQSSDNVVTLGLRSDGPARHIAIEDDQVIDIHRKLDRADGTHQFTGIYCINPELLERIPPHEKISVIPAFLELAREGRLGGCVLDEGHWLDLGTREAYLEAHRPASPIYDPERAVDPGATIDPTATVTESVIGPECKIGPGAIVRGSVLWPGSQVEAGAELERCIVCSPDPVSGRHLDADL